MLIVLWKKPFIARNQYFTIKGNEKANNDFSDCGESKMRQDLHYLFKKSKYNEKKVVICQIGGVDYNSDPTGYYYEPRDL